MGFGSVALHDDALDELLEELHASGYIHLVQALLESARDHAEPVVEVREGAGGSLLEVEVFQLSLDVARFLSEVVPALGQLVDFDCVLFVGDQEPLSLAFDVDQPTVELLALLLERRGLERDIGFPLCSRRAWPSSSGSVRSLTTSDQTKESSSGASTVGRGQRATIIPVRWTSGPRHQ